MILIMVMMKRDRPNQVMFWVVLSRLASYWSKAGRAAPTDKGKVLSGLEIVFLGTVNS
jgi:hypothetical protein